MSAMLINLLWAIAMGICAAMAIIPLARAIVARLEAQWAADVEEHALAEKDSAPLNFTLYDRIVIASVAIAIGFLAVST